MGIDKAGFSQLFYRAIDLKVYKDRVYVEIELINGGDLALVRRHRINMNELKRMNVKILVDNRVLCCV